VANELLWVGLHADFANELDGIIDPFLKRPIQHIGHDGDPFARPAFSPIR
jgi:hypothetical protein